jgi:SsrA-binding protein
MPMKIYSENKKAYFDYEILEKMEAGLVLLGTEVKSIRMGRATIKGAYIVIRGEEAYLIGANIPPYQPKNAPKDYDSQKSRKLLLKKSEINYLIGKTKESGISVLPLKIFDKNAKIKIEIGVGKGKKKFDKRQTIKKRETQREIKREINIRG